jgi:hypothetical protein
MTTKTVEVNGKEYTIKRMTLKERQGFNEFTASHKDNYSTSLEEQYFISHFCVSPSLTSQDIENMDYDEADKLYLEILKYNTVDKDFLLGLKNLQSQVSLLSQTLTK